MVGTEVAAGGENLRRLKALLAELFMFDQADLDFGIYRIMNLRREEIRRFLDDDLLPQVQEALGIVAAGERAAIGRELGEAEARARDLGIDPDAAPRVLELREKYDTEPDVAATEEEVYSHLVTFLRRYYREGDFISQRRYKEGVYAIPYEGEEVKLHWANADQFYVKSAEHFRDYTFRLVDDRRVHFRLVAASVETDNNRLQNGNDRRFILAKEESVAEQDGELVVRFEYRPDADGRKRDEVNTASAQQILNDPAATAWQVSLGQDTRPEGASEALSILRKHLDVYTAKNEFDYFIHKDLRGFLGRELDFYIKNEVMRLDDIDQDGKPAPEVERYIDKLRAIRRVGHKIIDLVAQLEDFQKRLWLKKKLVVETHWCVTLDRVPTELYPEIAANERQREEWVRLFAIDDMSGDSSKAGYSEPLTVEFLRANPYLVVDTSLFERAFTARLITSVEDLDDSTGLTLIQGDNFQALTLLEQRYRLAVDCIYIDPPYNTGNDGFLFKDNYQRSSWMSLMSSRLESGARLLAGCGAVFVSIDDNEVHSLRRLLDQVHGEESFVAQIAVWINPKGRQLSPFFATSHDYLLAYADSGTSLSGASTEGVKISDFPLTEGNRYYRLLPLRNTNKKFNPKTRENLAFPLYVTPTDGSVRIRRHANEDIEVWPTFGDGTAAVWRWSQEKCDKHADALLGRIVKGRLGERWDVFQKDFYSEQRTKKLGTVWLSQEVGSTDVAVAELGDLGLRFTSPKPTKLLQRIVALLPSDAVVLDYFAGSGTTGHAVVNLNRADGGNRKCILVDTAEYFDTVLKPRVLKSVYSKDWKDGKPVSREGTSQLIKVVRLESYEDALNNIEVDRTEQQQSLLDAGDGIREEYMLHYWLHTETRASPSLVNIEQFDDPWSYTLKIAQGSAAETRPVTVDLVESFNYLIGLRVSHVEVSHSVTMVSGVLPSGESALVIWRKVADVPSEQLNQFLFDQSINPRDMLFDVVYVNGDNHLENARRPDETWKVRLIEEEFLRAMFEMADRT